MLYIRKLKKSDNTFGVAPVTLKTSSNGSAANEKSHKLPLWLRDGLEKIKQEKQKKLEAKPAALFTQQTPKSFDSKKNVFSNDDDDDEEEEANESKGETNRDMDSRNNGRKMSKFSESGLALTKTPTKPPGLSVEEKQEIQINIVKIWMTEILLEVTNHVMESVAKEEFQYQKDRLARQKLKETKASLNIAYDDDDESSDDSDDNEDEEETVEFLRARGLKRFEEYEKKFQSEMARLSAQESRSSRRSDRRSRSRSRSRSSSSRHHKSSRRRDRRSRSRSRRRDSSDDDDRRRRHRRSRSPRSSRRDRSRSRSNHKRSRRSVSRSSSRSRSRDKKSSKSSRHHHKSSSKRDKRDRRSRSRSSSNRKHRSKRDRSRSRSSSSSPSPSKSTTKSK